MSVLNALFAPSAASSSLGFLQPSGLGLNNTFASPFGLGGGNAADSQQLMMVLLLKSLLSGFGPAQEPTRTIGLPLEAEPAPVAKTTTANTAAKTVAQAAPAATVTAAPAAAAPATTTANNNLVGITQPRAGNISVAGYPWLARSIDKARLKSEGKLDNLQLLFPCPQDQQLHKKLGIDSETFRQVVASSNSDDEVLAGLRAQGANIP